MRTQSSRSRSNRFAAQATSTLPANQIIPAKLEMSESDLITSRNVRAEIAATVRDILRRLHPSAFDHGVLRRDLTSVIQMMVLVELRKSLLTAPANGRKIFKDELLQRDSFKKSKIWQSALMAGKTAAYEYLVMEISAEMV